jgi:uncharacterized protein (TIGR04222 family)
MVEPNTALWERIRNYSLDDPKAQLTFSARLARENDWSPPFARRAVEEYKRFAFLAMAAGHAVTPSEEVDQVWHLHLTYTRDYWKRFCKDTLQKPLHHIPTTGGAADATRHRVQYEQTLASYRQWFGETPPVDIWPAADERFNPHAHGVRVNPNEAWIISKPWPFRAHRRSTSIVVGAWTAPLLFGLVNPFNLAGPQFLVFYAIIGAISIVAALFVRMAMRGNEPVGADLTKLNSYEIAALARGVPGVLQAGVAGLVASGRLKMKIEPARKWGPITFGTPECHLTANANATSNNSVEEAMLDAARNYATPDKVAEAAKPAAERVVELLQIKRLLESPDSFRAARWWPVAMVGLVWLLGAAKFCVGIARDKPVGFLGFGLIALAMVLAFFWHRPWRTNAGKELLARLQQENEDLKHAVAIRSTESPITDVVLVAALFGLASVQQGELQQLWTAMRPLPASSGGGTGCGAAGCGGGGGGGCGGGGCGGGCGGCGGGG